MALFVRLTDPVPFLVEIAFVVVCGHLVRRCEQSLARHRRDPLLRAEGLDVGCEGIELSLQHPVLGSNVLLQVPQLANRGLGVRVHPVVLEFVWGFAW